MKNTSKVFYNNITYYLIIINANFLPMSWLLQLNSIGKKYMKPVPMEKVNPPPVEEAETDDDGNITIF